jgi:antitoxin ParD1/3/4
MEERDVRCPFLFSVLCLSYYEIFLILQKIELLMKTTTVALGPHFEDFIQASILSGRYNNASEVVRSGLRLLEDQEYASRLAALRYAIDEGEASGDYEDFDPVANLAELNARRNG